MPRQLVDSAKRLSGRERVNRMFQRRDHDRVPRHDTYWKETIERWQSEGLRGDAPAALDLLGSDFAAIGASWPAPFPDSTDVTVAEDDATRTFIDGWGATVRYWKNRSGTPEHVAFGCLNRQAWEQRFKPVYQAYRWHQLDPDAVRRNYTESRRQGKWCFLTALESIEATRKLMGDEITMIAMAEEPDWVAQVSRVYTDTVLQGLDLLMATGVEPDGLWVYGDMAFNHSTFCSPTMYRDLIWPDHKRLADWAHAHGQKFIFHTDGDVNGVMDLYVEAGFDCLQPLEAKAHMDIRRLCPRYGQKMAFFGNIDVMVMGTNDHRKVEEEVRSKLAAGMATRGYAYHSDHSVPPTVSFETYQLIIALLDRYGNY